MSHRIRILDLHLRDEIEREMRRVGSDEVGVQIMTPKAQWHVLRIEGLRGKAASLLKQVMLSVGGEACVSRSVAAFDDTPAPVLVMGDRRHFRRLSPRLRQEPFGLPQLADEIERVLHLADETPPPVRCGARELLFGRSLVMGIINTTPDSFSGDGLSGNVAAALDQARQFAEAGVDILDIGGETTQPGCQSVPEDEEMARVLPVIERLATSVDLPLSVDTYKPAVVRAAVQAGASLINDVYALRQPGMLEVAAETGAAVCVMHMQGQPRDMQQHPNYEDLITEIYDFLAARMEAAIAAGVAEHQIIIDPGLGFGKTAAHNLQIVHRLREFLTLGRPLLLGPSRKRTIGEITGRPPAERAFGTAAMCAAGLLNGAHILRVHDVAAMVDVARVIDAVKAQSWPLPQAEGAE